MKFPFSFPSLRSSCNIVRSPKPKGSLRRLCPAALAALPILSGMLWGCASIGNPSGGPRDEDPPVFLKASPRQGAVGVSATLSSATLDFNEIVNVKDAFSKVMISPVGASTPRVSSQGRHIKVEFQDSLLPNTTYTVDFADAIVDNNEGNSLKGFFYTFSTGEVLDSLEISGMVLGARDLEPQKEMLVGIYSDVSDTAFYRKPFERIAMTDDLGRFTIAGLKPGDYRIYALKDLDNDKKYANPEEDVAFLPFTVSPSSERIVVTDTVFDLKTGKVDTVVSRERTRFLPNDILLRSFNTEKRQQFLAQYERKDSTRLFYRFNAPAPDVPLLDITGYPDAARELIVERSLRNDTVTFWLPRSLLGVDTLEVASSFLRPDSIGDLVEGTDMLDFITARPRVAKAKAKKDNAKKKKDNAEADTVAAPALPKAVPLGLSFSATGSQEVWQPLYLEFATPLEHLDTVAFRLEQKHDTIWKPAPRPHSLARADSLSPRLFRLEYAWDYETSYRVVADSAAAVGIYGAVLPAVSNEFSTKSEEEYSSLTFDIKGLLPTDLAFVELLNGSDSPVRQAVVMNGKAEFRHLTPAVYYARLVEDFNGNGQFDPGDPAEGRPSDQVFYYPGKLNVKKNWDIDQSWDVFSTAIDLQKPLAIKKNKPQSRRGEQMEEDLEEEEVFDPTANPFDPKDAEKRRRERQNQTLR